MTREAITKVMNGDSFMLEVYLDPFNKRVRIDDFRGNVERVIQASELVAKNNQAEKLICKVRYEHFSDFLVHGFCCEAKLDGYFSGSDAYFFSKYYQTDRLINKFGISEDQMMNNIYLLQRDVKENRKINVDVIRKADKNDVIKLAELYKAVFPVYPTPLHDPDYIVKTFKEGTIYFVIEQDDVIVSAASAEVNNIYKNAELTDCATLANFRKHGFVKLLLQKLEEELIRKGIFCVYSLARAQSFGMNAAFYQLGYQYRGRLPNNCFIYDKLENMNLWIKNLSKPE
ncbi:putative beta-lysine N-acetyltransferase [Bacillus sp. 1NLA3E]|uniref:putative beta-lysine N-acetyltransferase n=1 Tax=Bacillus sp. 1NLA3E TaxID=666686 RepID=UPI000247F16D|nr:putative beta-lysine N-acetyltransferase [Bacillus sp. 1NLA3E]AGK54559.1 N-acetyltransferase GCN5 [Bacillus sp. 1NLA3E]